MVTGVEVWRQVVGYARYEVSNQGRVRRSQPGKGTWAGRTISPQPGGQGYHHVKLGSGGGRMATKRLHRLVAEAFLGPATGSAREVNHKDGDKLNNHVDNLEWTTRSGNLRHAFATGLKSLPHGSNSPRSRLNEEAVKVIRFYQARGVTMRKLGRLHGVDATTIEAVVHRRTWRHVD